ncbi:BMC domain-containing protein [Sinanaerobacter sp. ZZT-01]|uniref:BMC domain-containing protein n=1 Tax=Sinanaerobacter sp. ZZT-01 TaxID=3111540 RepID=UPI002D782F93|nr:BMC domain-containing protein [Sinanaerobacter sp. ZZT-01]WRR92628.1 BMC domain-containing protein [Sinanaerobacter sp. ZZT-01]
MLKSLGLIETIGLAAAITAADAAVKSANVTLVGYELVKGSGRTVIKVEGDVGAVKAAIEAASAAALKVGRVAGTKVIARPSDDLESMIRNYQTVGCPISEVSLDEQIVLNDTLKNEEQMEAEMQPDMKSDLKADFIEESDPLSKDSEERKRLDSDAHLRENQEIRDEEKKSKKNVSEIKKEKSEVKPKNSQRKSAKKSGEKTKK